MTRLRRLTVIAVIALALAIGMAIGFGGGAAYADEGGVPNDNAIVGAEHANENAAHPDDGGDPPGCDPNVPPGC